MRWGILWAAVAVGALACGDDQVAVPDAMPPVDAGPPDAYAAVCGDAVAELDEECDDGNDDDDDLCANDCTLNVEATVNATVKWWFNRDEALGFEGDACIDVLAEHVDVEIVHIAQPTVTYTLRDECAFRQVTFVGVPEGGYRVHARPLDVDGEMLTAAPIELWTTFTEAEPEREIDVGYADWSTSYLGTYFFRVRWGAGGLDCAETVPPVAQQSLRLERDGVAVMQMTTAGDVLDGSQPGPCRPVTDEQPQVANDVPWGPAQLTVSGLDAKGSERYRSTFDTFVGAGLTNPELVFDVEATP